ncbi:disease resistance protein (TIR-NBS-LRR class), putative [Medicago truncatula]|uniref:ADP-ribosyl cyclase/cyclic ADP-ribose hydrolase n=1 Tax=Medicago truncatula TaxID=3880 RepID=G7JKM5_MEDTR|nr:disease resistance protein (TIR-NBS-LRR class), putative [Medicago truncatula]
MAYLPSGASQTIYAKQYRHYGSKALPDGIFARTSNSEMRPLWDFGISHLNLWSNAGVKMKEMVNKTVAKVKGVAEKTMSNNSPESKYDVFVSFRGEDIRHGFLGHLAKMTYHSIFEAIEGSFISLIIFSENYASSRWCLEELVKIIECREKNGQIVIPVFYEVGPTDVRHQKKSYENALVGHEKNYILSRVQKWRQTLEKSANLSGIKSLDFQNDVEILEEIINLVLKRLSKYPINTEGYIGIAKPVGHLESLLRQKSEKVCVIGIWGMGGIGKTTIAEEVYNRSCSEYEGCCFLAKVSDELGRHGTAFFNTISRRCENRFTKWVTQNLTLHMYHWKINRKARPIIPIDVKEENQLEILFGTLDWFRSDSRIIVTIRDKQVLITNEVDDIYEVGVLNYSEALELFNLNAFNQSHLEMEYYELSKKVIDYAKGIPLVLKVLAHLLRGKDKEEWESQLDKLKRLPNKKFQDVMRLSYDDLDRLEQKYFLDIACFFNGLRLKVDYMKLLLKDFESDNAVAVGLERLKDKSLITISEDNVISMHDILQEMGREVVRQESSEDPRKCSRLSNPDIIYDVLKNDKGTDAIRSISLDLSASRKLKLSPNVFDKMTNLQFLDFRDIDGLDRIPEGIQSFPTDLKYLHWICYPLKSLSEKFSAENLVILDLSGSLLEKLWCGVQIIEYQDLVNLKEVTLSHSGFLKVIPDFSKATNLNVLNIQGCYGLTSIHPSIFSLDKLLKLDLSLCLSLAPFTTNSNLSSLHYVSAIPPDALPSSFGFLGKLEILDLVFTAIESIPSSIKNLTRLRKLDIRFCSKLVALPELPSSVETLLVECESLKTVFFPSVINLMKFAYRHSAALLHHAKSNESNADYKDKFDSYQAVYLYPGSSVPEWFKYRTAQDDMIIDLSPFFLSPLLGFVFCSILAKDSQFCYQIELNITTIDVVDDEEKDGVSIFMYRYFFSSFSDHVCMIYDPPCSRYLTSIAKKQTRFKIKVTARTTPGFDRERPEVELKGFGIRPIIPLRDKNIVEQMELFDYVNKWSRTVLSIIICISFLRLKMKKLI